MKALLHDDGTLAIEGENTIERMALMAWEQHFFDGKTAFKIEQSEPIQRADEDAGR